MVLGECAEETAHLKDTPFVVTGRNHEQQEAHELVPFSPLGAGMPGNTCGEQQQRRRTAQMAVMGARAQGMRGAGRRSARAGRSAGANSDRARAIEYL